MFKHKKTFGFLPVLFLFLGTVLFTSCGNAVDPAGIAEGRVGSYLQVDQPTPIGVWYSAGEYYEEVFDITSDYIGYYVNDDLVFDGKVAVFLHDDDSKTSGIIYLQYGNTKYGIPGYYYAVRWEQLDLDEGYVWLSNCSEASGKETLAEAEKTYSKANKDIYFKYGSDFTLISSKKALPPSRNLTGKPPIIEHFEKQKALTTSE